MSEYTTVSKEEIEKMQEALQVVHETREKGLKRLQDKVQNLVESEVINVDKLQNPDLVSTLRELSSAVNASLQVLESEKYLSDMMINDLSVMYSKLNNTMESLAVTGTQFQTLLSVLQSKKIVSEDEMRETFYKLQQQFMQLKSQEQN